MFLLNDRMITENKGKGKLLNITPFEAKGLCPTYYYFRLGRHNRRWNSQKKIWELGELGAGTEVLEIQPREYLLVESFERFRCSKQVMAIFGQSSSLVRKGLSLRTSPFIDPNFPDEEEDGCLEIGLKNELNDIDIPNEEASAHTATALDGALRDIEALAAPV